MKTRALLLAFGALMVAVFSALGSWQLRRAVQKEGMLENVAAALSRGTTHPLAEAGRLPGGYDWAAGEGRFLPAPALLLDNQRRGQAVGVRVFAPFQPTQGPAMLVDLGWLPLPGDRRLPDVAAPAGEQSLRGLLAPAPTAGLALGPPYVVHDAHRWLMTRVDLPALSAGLKLPLAPRVLRLDPALPLGYARDLDVLPNTLPPERHRGYALQWFGLAAASLVISLLLGFRHRP